MMDFVCFDIVKYQYSGKMPRTRQEANIQEEDSENIEISLIETQYGENTVAETNFNALMKNMEQIPIKLTAITDDVGKILRN